MSKRKIEEEQNPIRKRTKKILYKQDLVDYEDYVKFYDEMPVKILKRKANTFCIKIQEKKRKELVEDVAKFYYLFDNMAMDIKRNILSFIEISINLSKIVHYNTLIKSCFGYSIYDKSRTPFFIYDHINFISYQDLVLSSSNEKKKRIKTFQMMKHFSHKINTNFSQYIDTPDCFDKDIKEILCKYKFNQVSFLLNHEGFNYISKLDTSEVRTLNLYSSNYSIRDVKDIKDINLNFPKIQNLTIHCQYFSQYNDNQIEEICNFIYKLISNSKLKKLEICSLPDRSILSFLLSQEAQIDCLELSDFKGNSDVFDYVLSLNIKKLILDKLELYDGVHNVNFPSSLKELKIISSFADCNKFFKEIHSIKNLEKVLFYHPNIKKKYNLNMEHILNFIKLCEKNNSDFKTNLKIPDEMFKRYKNILFKVYLLK